MTTEILLIIEGVKNGQPFTESSRGLNGMKLALEHRDRLLAQTGLSRWQPNITGVTVKTREVTDWVEYQE